MRHTLNELIENSRNLGKETNFLEWCGKVGVILRATFGESSIHLRNFEAAVRVRNEGYTLASGERRDLEAWRRDAAVRGKAVLTSAVYALEVITDVDSPLDEASIDPDLWEHVKSLVSNGDWAKVPAQVAIFVEDCVRRWAGDPRSRDGGAMVGKALYTAALNDSGQLRMGRQASEWEGWRSLGVGLAQAVGNVDRHRIQRRDDSRRYAMGVLGLGSLLLTQLRYEHPAALLETEQAEIDEPQLADAGSVAREAPAVESRSAIARAEAN